MRFAIATALALSLFAEGAKAQSVSDNFDRPEGAVANGWGSWNGTTITAGQLATFGSDGAGGGIFRSFPVTFPLSFSLGFRTESPLPPCSSGHPGGAWIVAFNAPGEGYAVKAHISGGIK